MSQDRILMTHKQTIYDLDLDALCIIKNKQEKGNIPMPTRTPLESLIEVKKSA